MAMDSVGIDNEVVEERMRKENGGDFQMRSRESLELRRIKIPFRERDLWSQSANKLDLLLDPS